MSPSAPKPSGSTPVGPRAAFPGPAVGPGSMVISVVAHGALLAGVAWAIGFRTSSTETDLGAREVVLIAAAPQPEVIAPDLPAEDLDLELPDVPTPEIPVVDTIEEPIVDEGPEPIVPPLDVVPDLDRRPLPNTQPDRAPAQDVAIQEAAALGAAQPTDPAPIEPAEDVPTPADVPEPDRISVAEQLDGSCPKPKYPGLAVKRGWVGTVVVTIDVRMDGTVSDVRVVTSSGRTVLDDAVLKAVRTWRFTPATQAGAAVKSEIEKTFVFTQGGVQSS